IHYFKHTYHGEYDIYRGTEEHRVEGYSTDLFADAACDFIRRKAPEGPFFVYLPFNAPHYLSEVNLIPGEDEKPEWHVPGKYLERYGWPADDPTEKHRYLALLTALDDGVGRVLDAIDEAGERDNTLVIYLSDMGAILRPTHGLGVASNLPFRDGAPSMYEGGVRVPAIVRWPGRIEPGTVCGEMLSHLDLLPLCLAAAGLPLPEGRIIDGRNPLPALTGKAPSPHEFLTFHYGNAAGMRAGDWKVARSKADKPWELFDLASDPGETRDLAKEKAAEVSRLDAIYRKWSEEVNADATEPAPRPVINKK
ncbi:MAG: sulfatase-like hydrolase/transferase, partial [Verrucomicrobiae bacterium]|nr:sulfatase-like hydrolase/transferase [Verrucomicrobiae bacterium]